MSNFSMRLRGLRQQKKMSQQALANAIGASKSSINMYERGEREPGFETLEAIADFFNVDLNYLMGWSDKFTVLKKKESPSPSEEDKGEECVFQDIRSREWAFAERLDAAMKARNLSVEEFAALVQNSAEDIQKILDHQIRPSRRQGVDFSNALKVKFTFLTGFPVSMNRNYYTPDGQRLNNKQAMMFEAYEFLSEEDKSAILRMSLSVLDD